MMVVCVRVCSGRGLVWGVWFGGMHARCRQVAVRGAGVVWPPQLQRRAAPLQQSLQLAGMRDAWRRAPCLGCPPSSALESSGEDLSPLDEPSVPSLLLLDFASTCLRLCQSDQATVHNPTAAQGQHMNKCYSPGSCPRA